MVNKEAELKKTLLGILGEKIVAKYLRDCGHQVNESLYMFDSSKDMEVDGLHVEVKTQTPFLIHDAFAVSINQMNKIQNSHRVYWVSVPPSKVNDVLAGYVFEMDPKIASSFLYRLKTGREVMCFKRNQEGMKIVHQIKDQKLLSHLQELSTSYM
jgi:meiotically up-regulated gene 157 (Mug157) protein